MNSKVRRVVFVFLCCLTVTSLSCTISLLQLPDISFGPTQAPAAVVPSPTPLPRAETVFMVVLPEPLGAGESLALSVLDEVTGLSINPQNYPMQAKDNLTYTANMALPYNAVVKYRYVRISNGSPIQESTTLGDPIRYRMYFVAGQGEVKDLIAGWSDKTYKPQTGSIQGRVLNVDTGAPIPNILVTAGGEQSFSDSAGRFDLQGLPAGTHTLAAYALDGMYQAFEQGATIAPNLTTAVEVKVKAATLVHVTFNLNAPNDIRGAPVRIAGNLIELGDTFADLEGGLSTIAEQMPIMTLQPDGHYSATISLPAGAYIQYKYTLGDGFWNAEHHAADGSFLLREMIVPQQDVVLQDSVETWQAGNSSPMLFEVTVPSSTPVNDLINIQFNPYGWTEPIPMWPVGSNKWIYKLYSPLNMLGTFHYRYCRNGQCGSADDIATAGENATGRQIETSLVPQDIQDTVTGWAWLDNTQPSSLTGSTITARPNGFMSGVEFQSTFQPNWSYYNPQAVKSVQALGANWVIYTPSWTFNRVSPLTFGLVPGDDPFWLNSAIMISQARASNLNAGIFPIPHFTTGINDFWKNAPRDANWWQTWFDYYRAFAVNYADLATQSGSQALILGGGGWISPALPNGTLSDGSPSGVPNDADARWQAIIAEVHQHFSGNVLWALPYTPGKLQTSLTFLKSTDGIYLLWNTGLAAQPGASKADMANHAGQLLDNEVSPLPSILNKPIILALSYPSASGATTNCVSDGSGGCLDWTALSQPNNPASTSVDLQGQSDLYEAMLNAINTRPWVGGIVSRGFYPPAALQDKSASVHGKPAADLLWYWFPRLTGVVK
jgi:hypothetical protein